MNMGGRGERRKVHEREREGRDMEGEGAGHET
jgi:hypothetical protein